ncbi:conserved hypothetical protein [Trichinella spiralis]|uniref:hypothetical protein n=1 Tax=Trichinella spiralis TaxID=6334 RepID=UPI0001EFC53F|nr:conserved hypothetical protein [Trichinella spiralis]
MPACKIIAGKMLGHDGARKIENIPLSSTFLLFKLMSQQISPTNVTQLVFVRFINECEIQEIFFCCKELPEMSKRKDVFNVLSSHLETKDFSWKNCVGICTDGALSMVGSMRGFVSLSLAYLADIFGHTNLLNKKLQGSNENILTSNDKILRFKKE